MRYVPLVANLINRVIKKNVAQADDSWVSFSGKVSCFLETVIKFNEANVCVYTLYTLGKSIDARQPR